MVPDRQKDDVTGILQNYYSIITNVKEYRHKKNMESPHDTTGTS